MPEAHGSYTNALISHNNRLAPKILLPHRPNAHGSIFIVQHHSVTAEVQTLAQYIDWYLLQHPGLPAGEVLVLSSRRQIGNDIRERLNSIAQQHQRGWEAQSFYFEDALSRDVAADGFALLTLLVDPDDQPSLRYWLGEHAQDCRRGVVVFKRTGVKNRQQHTTRNFLRVQTCLFQNALCLLRSLHKILYPVHPDVVTEHSSELLESWSSELVHQVCDVSN